MGAMTSVLVFLLIALILFCFVAIIIVAATTPGKRKPSKGANPEAYEATALLTEKESALFEELRSVAERAQMAAFAKVRMGNLMSVAKDAPDYSKWISKVKNGYVDFLLCRKDTMKAIMVVQMDDRGVKSNRPYFQKSKLLDEACDAAGIPVLHIRNYEPGSLEKALMQKLRRGAAAAKPAVKEKPAEEAELQAEPQV